MIDPCSSRTPSRAFIAAPDPSRYFPAAAIEEARQKISRCIELGEGPALLVGPAGSGKSLLLEVLAQQFSEQRDVVSLPGAQLCSRRALLQMILFQLGLTFRGVEEGELRVALHSHLRPQEGQARQLLLLVDEAESLPARLLEELRVLTNLVDRGQVLVSLVLAGNASLEERFAEPKMEVLNQRIAARSYLSAMGREETFQYVCAQVAAAGSEPDQLFSSDGLEAIFAATDGMPRLINQLGSQLIWMAHETGYAPIDGKLVQQAWSELQQLPAPWELSSSANDSIACDTPVEFGELSIDDSDPLQQALFEEPEMEEQEVDHPASIRLFSSQHSELSMTSEDNSSTMVASEHCEIVEHYDATEQIVEQLEQIKENGIVAVPQAATAPLSKNPFDESFDSEEVVLDRYLEFEGKLLATAKRVINHVDTSFAHQLSQCEVSKPEPIQQPSLANFEEHEVAIAKDLDTLLSVTTTICDSSTPAIETLASPISVVLVDNESQAANLPVNEVATYESGANEMEQISLPVNEESGELLVVEDLGRSGASVVPGSKFRHLFSSLEKKSCSGFRNAE